MNKEYCDTALEMSEVAELEAPIPVGISESETSVMEKLADLDAPVMEAVAELEAGADEVSESLRGYPVRQYREPVKRYCQVMEITDNPELISKYRECHASGKAWPEVLEGIREVGILEMEMYILGNKVMMIVETPLDFEWKSAMAKLATLPRQADWESFVAAMQGCDPSATSDQKWQLMERMFYLYED